LTFLIHQITILDKVILQHASTLTSPKSSISTLHRPASTPPNPYNFILILISPIYTYSYIPNNFPFIFLLSTSYIFFFYKNLFSSYFETVFFCNLFSSTRGFGPKNSYSSFPSRHISDHLFFIN